MAMQIGGDEDGDEALNSAINTTPLVDVMLVLLIIFLITIPVVIDTVPVKLPQEQNRPTKTRPENIVLVVDRNEQIYWGNQPVADLPSLLARLREEAVKQPQPEVHIRGDQQTHYRAIGRVVYTAQQAGILKVGLITEPPPRG